MVARRIARNILDTVFALTISLGTAVGTLAAAAAPWDEPYSIEQWAHDFTVLTMAPDGAWGTATDPRVNRAIAGAIKNCKEMSGKTIGCGAYQTTTRGGWSLAIRCGYQIILVADRDLAEAERRAAARETELRDHYVRDMPPCARVVTVDPNGGVIVPPVAEQAAEAPVAR
jgi:hypothetical protein